MSEWWTQDVGIWIASLGGGGILSLVLGGLLPVTRKRYAEAEERRLAAKELRRA